MTKTKLSKTNEEYWKDRQIESFTEGEADALDLAKKLLNNYNLAVDNIQKEIYSFYGKYAKDNNISLAEAKRMLNKSELKTFNAQLDEYMKYLKKNGLSGSYLTKLKLLKAKANVSRLEELKANIEFEIAKLVYTNYDEMENTLQDIYDEAYYKNMYNMDKYAQMSISFAKPNAKAVEKYLNQNINLANYSITGKNAIWQRQDKLMNILSVKIPQGITLGYNPKKVAKLAADPVEKDYNNIVRLVRTEYSYILNEATNDSYIQCGIPQYQILAALDERTCNDCGDLDLQIVNVSDREVGVNSPPFHPNCRCTTIPYFEPDEFNKDDKRIAKDKENKPYMVPADLTFKEWKAGLIEHEGGEVYWKPSK